MKSVDKSVFDLPNYSIKINKDKPKTLKKSTKSRDLYVFKKKMNL